MIQPGIYHFLCVAAVLFCLGMYCVVTRRNAVGILMGVELILNAANVNFVAFARFGNDVAGQVFAVFVIVLAAAEAAVALAIVLAIFHNLKTIDVEEAQSLKE